jgi:protein SCO1/2
VTLLRLLAAATAVAAVLAFPLRAAAQYGPSAGDDVGVVERLGQELPFDILLAEPGGEPAPLRHWLPRDRPVLLILAYVRCEMLCSVVLDATARALREIPLVPGRDFELITVSIDPQESPAAARAKQAALTAAIARPGQSARWRFLRGDEPAIRRLAGALGFRYVWDARTEQYAHPAVIFVLTPDGRISRYLHGVAYTPAELTGSLQLAATGGTGASLAGSVLRCFRFDPADRRYSRAIRIYFQLGAAAIFACLLVFLANLVARERRRRA